MVALFAAEGAEAQALRRHLELLEVMDGPFPIHRGQVGRYELLLLEAGVGKAAAAASVAYVKARFNPTQAYWVGVAGALNPELRPLDLLVGQDAVQYDVDITAFGRQPGELATGERFVPADAALTSKVMRSAQNLGVPLFLGRVASADRFLADPLVAAQVRAVFSADAVEMEGAAALWTARRMGMPMALIRAITDSAGQGAELSFEEFLETASVRLASLIKRILET
ncbi:MAG: 5'-methylthioadenosine/S-adenosylhomocysteine nucleosidase [Meiothermus sp.]|nr:5'-methylthioadenosine/S-adenosylhomocysteine nucleosidase [Meiothermus sp.]